jgi:tetratricopeptide (TPR) repeat protein
MAAEWGGDEVRAISLYQSALAVAHGLNNAQAASVVLYALGDAAYRRGGLETAERLSEEALALLRSVGAEFELSLCLTTCGAMAFAGGDMPRAIRAYEEALNLALGIEVDWAVASTLSGFAAIAAARGDRVGAAQLLGAIETVREASHQYRIAHDAHLVQTTHAVRAALGAPAFAAAWQAGRALPREEAVDLPRTLGLL